MLKEFLKRYIAYKAEIDDPRGLCRDVTGLGRWGNGHGEVHLESLADLPYISGRVRHALDKQLGENDEDS